MVQDLIILGAGIAGLRKEIEERQFNERLDELMTADVDTLKEVYKTTSR